MVWWKQEEQEEQEGSEVEDTASDSGEYEKERE
jgi:hypothetical protein